MFPDKMIANIAMDMSINQCIGEEEAPLTFPDGKDTGIVMIENFSELKLEKNQSSLYYYNRLQQAKEEKKSSKGKKEDSKAGPKGNGNGTSGCKELDKFLDNEEAIGDWHDKWKELSEGMGDKEKELFRKEMQEIMKRIGDETEKLRGTVPAHIANSLKEDFGNKPPIISWKTLFNRFIGSTLTTDIYQTRKRPNFRFEDAPSNKYKNKIRIVCGLDTSGSVSDHELKEFYGQVKHMWKAGVKVDIILWDAEADEPYEYKGELTYKRTRGGGTRASCFIEYVNKHRGKKNWTCAITLTDGYIESNPSLCKIPMLWVITQNGSTEFNHPSKKIKIN